MELELADTDGRLWHAEMRVSGGALFTGGRPRKGDRRNKRERREMLRFEVEKKPRRRSNDRRGSSAWDGRHEY